MASIKKLRSGTSVPSESGVSKLPDVTLNWNFQNDAAPLSSMYANASHQVISRGPTIKKPGS